MNLIPLGQRVIVEKQQESERKYGSIIIPQSAKDTEQSWLGKVVAVGPGLRLENGHLREPRVKASDTVLIGKYHGTEVELDGKKLCVVLEDDILGVVE